MPANDASDASQPRFWYCGDAPPCAEGLGDLLRPDAAPVAGDGTCGTAMAQARQALTALQRNALPLDGDTPAARMERFLDALFESTRTPAQRVQVLQQLGRFRLPRADSPQVRRQKVAAAVQDRGAGSSLPGVWRPMPESFLDALLHHPSEASRALARHLGGADGASVGVVRHALDRLTDEGWRALQTAGAIAFRRGRTVHLLGEADGFLAGAPDDGTLAPLPLLLLHEAVDGLLQDTTDLDALAAHIVAAAFERCLAGRALPLAVAAFFADRESRAPRPVPPIASARPAAAAGAEAGDAPLSWEDCVISHDQLRPEAFVEHTNAERRRILREMFGDEWSDDDDRDLEAVERAAA